MADFLDYYFQSLGYLASRKERRARFDADTRSRDVLPSSPEYAKEFKSYCGRERVILRRRRTKLKVDQFHIIAQVGQGGYGEVFLARKQVHLLNLWIINVSPIHVFKGLWRSMCLKKDEEKNII